MIRVVSTAVPAQYNAEEFTTLVRIHHTSDEEEFITQVTRRRHLLSLCLTQGSTAIHAVVLPYFRSRSGPEARGNNFILTFDQLIQFKEDASVLLYGKELQEA